MAQISRPFQIVLAAFVLFAVAWFALIHRPGGESSTSSSSPSIAGSNGATAHVATHASAAVAHPSSSATKRVHGGAASPAHHRGATYAKAATHANAKAATTRTDADQAATRAHSSAKPHAAAAARASGGTHPPNSKTQQAHGQSAASVTAGATAASILHTLTAAVHLSAVVKLLNALDPALNLQGKVAHDESVLIAHMKADLKPASQATVAAELGQHKTVLLLFLNPHAYDDDAAAISAVEVAYKLHHGVTAHLALASQVNSFGSITRDIQIYQTPTLLIVNAKRQVTTLTGLTDEFALKQAIAEAKG